jgi:hypothetical protein
MDLSKFAVSIDPGENFINAKVGFEVEAAKLYPAMVADIKDALNTGKGPDKYLDTNGTPNPLAMYWADAQRLGGNAFDLALVPFDSCAELSAADKAKRNDALECARKWFTELLHQSVNGESMFLHITSDAEKTFKLC